MQYSTSSNLYALKYTTTHDLNIFLHISLVCFQPYFCSINKRPYSLNSWLGKPNLKNIQNGRENMNVLSQESNVVVATLYEYNVRRGYCVQDFTGVHELQCTGFLCQGELYSGRILIEGGSLVLYHRRVH